MKKCFVGFALCLFAMTSCQKENLKNVDDVCTRMDDINFMSYCYDKFDVNHDGKVSMSEAAAIKEINLESKQISSLNGIEYFTQLYSLNCNSTGINSLDVTKNPELTLLYCCNNRLTSLDISKNSKLATLHCSNNRLTSLDVSNNPVLFTLWCSYNELTLLDISMLTNIKRGKYLVQIYSGPAASPGKKDSLYGCQLNDITISIKDKKEYWGGELPPDDSKCRIKWIWD